MLSIDLDAGTLTPIISQGKKFGIAGASAVAGVAVGIGAVFAATGILAPLGLVSILLTHPLPLLTESSQLLIGVAIVFGASAYDEYVNKTNGT